MCWSPGCSPTLLHQKTLKWQGFCLTSFYAAPAVTFWQDLRKRGKMGHFLIISTFELLHFAQCLTSFSGDKWVPAQPEETGRFIILDKAQTYLPNVINQPENKTVIACDYSDNGDDSDCWCSPRCSRWQALVIIDKPLPVWLRGIQNGKCIIQGNEFFRGGSLFLIDSWWCYSG